MRLIRWGTVLGLGLCLNGCTNGVKYKVVEWGANSPACFINEAICVETPKFKRINYESSDMLITYPSDQNDDIANAVLKKYRLRAKKSMELHSIDTKMITAATNGQDPETLVSTIKQHETAVEASTNNFFTVADVTSNATHAGYPLSMTRVPEVRQHTEGKGVVIGMIDTPVDLEYGDTLLAPFIERIDLVPAGDARNRLHGTEVAGIMVSKNPRIGIAPEAKLVAISAFSANPSNPNERRSNSALIAEALELAMRQGVDVLNLSFAGQSDPVVDRLVGAAVAKGIIVVASAGNNGPQAAPAYPAALPGVIAVTAVDNQQRLFAQANQGDYVQLAAPGVGILTTAPGGAFQLSSGTSLASAHVSGAIALLLAANRQAFHPNILQQTAQDLGMPGKDHEYGYGLMDTERALRHLNQ